MPPRTRGIQQRLRAAREDGADPSAASASVPRSTYVDTVLHLVALGLLSAPTAQELSAALAVDGLHHPEIAKVAAVGSKGQWPGNDL
jgi:hypothetical protein